MGKANNALNHFLQDNREFADVINLCIYGGQKMIRPEDLDILRLLKLDGDKKAIYEEVKGHPEYENLKRETGHVLSALLGDERIKQCIESQKDTELLIQ